MLACVKSSTLLGINALIVSVEVDITPGLPNFAMVGLPDAGAAEAHERVWAALRNSQCPPPLSKVVINLAPGDVRKEGPRFDLAIALATAAAGEDANRPRSHTPLVPGMLQDLLVLGELAMDGSVRRVRGILPSVIEARRQGIRRIMVPWENRAEAALAEDVEILAVSTLSQAIKVAAGDASSLQEARYQASEHSEGAQTDRDASTKNHDLCFVRGQKSARRALEICAAGGHHLLMLGPPGSGKTMLAQCLPSILPPLSREQALEVTAIHSIMSETIIRELHKEPPFRAPVSNISLAGLVGSFSPGEISLAHRGVLFTDEFPEFRRDCLEALRAPLENGTVQVARARFHTTFPCRFTLVAAMNPCPCGYFGDSQKECVCTYAARERYFHRISGPLLDRIDLQVRVGRPSSRELLEEGLEESSAQVRARVLKATQAQRQRGVSNAGLNRRQTLEFCPLDSETRKFMRQAMDRYNLSARIFDRLSRTARTIADLAGRPNIELQDVCEAFDYRALERSIASNG